MKKIFTLLFTLISFLGYSQSTTVVISQVYGAGGNAGATYNADFVELHNISANDVNMNGYSVQYASATSTTTWTGVAVLPDVTIPAGGYYLIQMSTVGPNGIALPTVDLVATPSIAMAAANGKVALVNGVTALTACTEASIVDLVGYGTANCAEGTSTAALSPTTAALRNNNGCSETDDNSVDFSVDVPAPRNSASAVQDCSSTPASPTVTTSTLTDFGTVTVGSSSASQTLTISGTDLTGFPGTLAVTAPGGFEVSLDGTTWLPGVEVPFSQSTLDATTIFVRFTPANEGVITGNITISGGGLTPAVTVAVSGTGETTTPATPTVTASTLTDFGTVTVGSSSASQTLTVSGTDLTGAPGDITVTAPAGFEVSLDGTTWTTTVNIPYTSATLASTSVFVRFTPTAAGAASGNITINGGGIATAVSVAVSGNGGGTTPPTTSGIVISQAYGAGGNAGATFNADYVELKNITNGPLSLNGLSIQYGSATSTTAWTGVSALPDVTIPAGGFYLIQMSTVGANGAALPTPDFIATPSIAMAGANGKVALVTGTTAISTCTDPTIVDLLGYGTANCAETNPSAALSATGAAMRINNGCTDTNDNSADFTVETPAPRNSATTPAPCGTTPTNPTVTTSTLSGFGSVNVGSSSASQTLTISGTNLTGAPGNITVTAPAGFEVSLDGTTWTTSVTVPYTSETLASTSVFVRFTPTAAGAASGNITISGGGLTPDVTVAVSGTGETTTPATPTVTASTLTDFGTVTVGSSSASQTLTVSGTDLTGAPGDITVTAPAGFEVSLDGTTWTTTVNIPYTSATLASTSVFVRFTPTAAGAASGNITINGGGIATAVSVAVSGNGGGTTPPTTSGIVISQAYGAGGNAGATFNADYVELKNITNGPLSLNGLSIQYGSATSTTAWTGVSALPDVTIPAGGFYLIQMSTVGANGAALPTPDFIATPSIAMAGANGKVALVTGTTAISTCTDPTIVDLLGYGTANCAETNPSAALSATGAAMRINNGCTDTNDNSADFTVETPAPRNSATTPAPCGTTPTNPTVTTSTLSGFGSVNVGSSSASQTLTISGTNLTGAPGNITVTAPAGFEVSLDGTTWTTSVTVPYTSETLASTSVFVRFTPTAAGAASGNITISGGGLATSVNVAVSGTGGAVTPPSTHIVISQVYGGGGNSGAPFNADFVEIHNGTNSPVSLAGMSVQYASATNTSTWNSLTALPAVTIPAGGYFLVQMSDPGANGSALPTPDHVASPAIAMAGANGKVALVNGTSLISSCTESIIIDLVGYGTASCGETNPTPALSNSTAGFRNENVCIDTDNNLADFTIAAPAPRNSASPINICGGPQPTLTASSLPSFGSVVVGQTSASQTITLTGTLLTGAPGNITVTAPAGFEVSLDGTTWTSSVTIPYTSETLASTSIFVRFTPTALGTVSGNITITGGSATTNVAVTGEGATTPADVTATALEDFGTVCVNEVGGPNSFTLTGTGLNTTPVVVGPLNGFTFSTTAGGTYSSTLTIPQSGGTFNQTIFVKFLPLAATSYSGDIPVTGGGIAGTLNVAATAAGNPAGGSILTGMATNILATSATAAGIIDEAGCSPATEYGIVYSGIQNFPDGVGRYVPSTNINAEGMFTSQLTGLVQNTIYYYKAYVINAGVTTYGEEKTFTTPPIGNGLIVYSNPITRGNTMHFSISGLQPGHYTVRFFNMLGQAVLQRDIILQTNYIDDYFVVPTTVPKGVYRFQVINQKFKAEKTILVL